MDSSRDLCMHLTGLVASRLAASLLAIAWSCMCAASAACLCSLTLDSMLFRLPACPSVCLFPADPLELSFKPESAFVKAGESEELKDLRFQHHEQLRQVRAGTPERAGTGRRCFLCFTNSCHHATVCCSKHMQCLSLSAARHPTDGHTMLVGLLCCAH